LKKLTLVILLLVASLLLPAQNKTKNIRAPRLKVGVVLGGGGAKGASHIGVLKYIEEMGIPIDYVAGTSMGSIIGGLYALGYTPDELTELISGMNWSEYIGNKIDRPMMSEELKYRNSTMVLNVPFSDESLFDHNPDSKFISQLPSAYVNNSSLINLFNNLCVGYQEEMDFNDLPIPFACVATDMITGEEVVLRQGCVPTAMRASMAIPGVFSPVSIDTAVLVDGGLVNNFPADVLKKMGADIIIGVEVSSTKDVTFDDLQSLPQVFSRLLVNTTSAKRVENRELCDVHIIPDVSGYGMLSFTPDAIQTLVGRGYDRASEFHDQLLSVKMAVDASAGHPVSKTLHAPHAKNLTHDPVLVRSITINNASDRDCRWLIRKGKLKVGNYYLERDIERAMKVYRGTGCFDEVTYQVKESDSIHFDNTLSDAYDLSVNMKPAKPHVFGLGLRYDTEDGAALLLNIGLNEKKFNGSKLNLTARLSYNPRLNLTYTYSRSSLANINLAYDYRNEHFSMRYDNKRSINMRYYQHKFSGYIAQFHLLNVGTNVGLSYVSTKFDLFTIDQEFDTVYFAPNKILTPFVDIKYDNLDDAYFAKHGIKARLSGRYNIDTKNFKDKYPALSLSFQSYITPGNGRFTIIPQVYGHYVLGSPEYFNLYGVFGGQIESRHFDQQMPFVGYASVESGSDVLTVLRCDLRYNIYKQHYLTAMYNHLINSYWGEPINEWFNNSAQGAGLQYSYNSFLGPISLTAHWSKRYSENHFGAYFSFGYSF
jgi:NTE family protein